MAETEMKRHPLAIAWDEWLASEEGQQASNVDTLARYTDRYLENRLHRAFDAGAKAATLSPSDFEQLIGLRKQASLFDEIVRDLEMRTCYGCNNRIGWNETPTKYGDWTKCPSCRNARVLLKQVAALREALAHTGEQS